MDIKLPRMSNCNLTEGTVTRVDNWQVVIYAISFKTLPKEPRIQGWSSAYQSNLFRSYHKFKHKSWSNFIFRISTKHQLQNFNQTSASWLNLKFTILSRISTKIQLHNLYKTSATKYRPNSSFKFCLNFNFKILTKPCAQSLNKSLALWTILSYQICNKLLFLFVIVLPHAKSDHEDQCSILDPSNGQ